MRSRLLVPIHTYPDASTDKLAAHVVAVARHLDAEVHALVLLADFPPVSSMLGNFLINVPNLIKDARSKCRIAGAALVEALKSELEAAGIAFTSSEETCFPPAAGERTAIYARYHDLSVCGWNASDLTSQEIAEAVIFGAGRPTLLVHEQDTPTTFQKIMIAWDGSRVAARAVADARDFLQRAERITVASVTDEKSLPDDNPGKRLAAYLARYGRQVDVVQVRGGARPIAQSLQDHARETGADMLVMGAFGHSRARDFVLGGATKGILKNLRIPTFLSH